MQRQALRQAAADAEAQAQAPVQAPAPEPVQVARPAPKPVPEPAPEPPEPERARDDDGHFAKDDPATPDVNEAFVGGEAPKPKWGPKTSRGKLMAIAKRAGLDLDKDATKREIQAALKKAGL